MKFITSEYFKESSKTWIEVNIHDINEESQYLVSYKDNSQTFLIKSNQIRFVKNNKNYYFNIGYLIEFKVEEGWKEASLVNTKGKFYYLKTDEDEYTFEREKNIRKIEVIEPAYIELKFTNDNKQTVFNHERVKDVLSKSSFIKSHCFVFIKQNLIRILNKSILQIDIKNEAINMNELDSELIKNISHVREMITLVLKEEEELLQINN